jgi:hypothetical protein
LSLDSRIRIRIFARTLSRNCQSSACASRLIRIAKPPRLASQAIQCLR